MSQQPGGVPCQSARTTYVIMSLVLLVCLLLAAYHTVRLIQNLQEMTAMWKQNPFASLVPDQRIAIIPKFTLECGQELCNAPVAYTTHGKLSNAGDNVVVVCHALSGGADVSKWWAPLIGGPGCPLDTSSLFVVCLNSLGSPYGTASPVTYRNGQMENGRYGPNFPPTTIRDDVK